ncbi:hypothetical protein [Bacillus cereus]|nr:hypothetical protein [Bacillus cereus]
MIQKLKKTDGPNLELGDLLTIVTIDGAANYQVKAFGGPTSGFDGISIRTAEVDSPRVSSQANINPNATYHKGLVVKNEKDVKIVPKNDNQIVQTPIQVGIDVTNPYSDKPYKLMSGSISQQITDTVSVTQTNTA